MSLQLRCFLKFSKILGQGNRVLVQLARHAQSAGGVDDYAACIA